jgi:orotate phosphoribosyltransferase
MIEQEIRSALNISRGHFRFESGHHGEVWLELDTLFTEARRMRRWAAELAQRAARCRPELVAGPLTGGAFLAQAVAAELEARFIFTERVVSGQSVVSYHLPPALAPLLPGRRLLLVDDAINAGSAVQATLAVLLPAGAELAGIGSLLSLGRAAAELAGQYHVPLFSLLAMERGLWSPEACPLCAAGLPLTDRIGPT